MYNTEHQFRGPTWRGSLPEQRAQRPHHYGALTSIDFGGQLIIDRPGKCVTTAVFVSDVLKRPAATVCLVSLRRTERNKKENLKETEGTKETKRDRDVGDPGHGTTRNKPYDNWTNTFLRNSMSLKDLMQQIRGPSLSQSHVWEAGCMWQPPAYVIIGVRVLHRYMYPSTCSRRARAFASGSWWHHCSALSHSHQVSAGQTRH